MSGPVSGTATVVLGDVAGSTRLWQAHPEAMAAASQRLAALADELVTAHDGHRPREQGEGDNLVAVFPAASDAAAFALALDAALAAEPWDGGLTIAMRIGLHTGDVTFEDTTGYLGPTFNRCARLRDLGHARMVLLSQATRDIVTDTLPDGARVEDLGVHQLRDLSRNEHVYQLRAADDDRSHEPLKSVSSLPNNLPVPIDTLVGRTAEIAAVATLFREHRLVTLTGAGGSGKTRLAQHVAAELVSYAPDGAWWVDLMPVTDDDTVPRAIGEAAGLTDTDDEHALAAALGDKQLLLVVDNCEHVIDAAADAVEGLLAGCPGVRVLATSREALDIPGEHTVRVRPLGVPVPDEVASVADLEAHDATRLFLERAAANAAPPPTAEEVPLVATICGRLDGIPLAIELAAARSRVLPLGEIAASLDDRFAVLGGGRRRRGARQRTLEASVAWSYDLLDEDEQGMLRRLGVFPGAFDLEAAAAVGAPGTRRAVALELLTSLVDRSLVTVRPASDGRRYRLLETIRQYALDRLHDQGTGEEARDAHLDHIEAVCTDLWDQGIARHQTEAGWFDIEVWLDDIRAAEQWALHRGRPDAVVRLLAPFSASALSSGRGREWVRAARAVVDDERLTPYLRAVANGLLGIMLPATGASEEGLDRARRALHVLEDADAVFDRGLGLLAVAMAGPIVDGSGVEEARDLYALGRDGGPGGRALYGWVLASALVQADRYAEAHEVASRSMRDARTAGIGLGEALNAPIVAICANALAVPGGGTTEAIEAHHLIKEHYPAFLPIIAAVHAFWPLVNTGDDGPLDALIADAVTAGAGPRRSGAWLFATVARGMRAMIGGDLDESASCFDTARAALAPMSMPYWEVTLTAARALVHAMAGEAEDALQLVDEGRALLVGDHCWAYPRTWFAAAAQQALGDHDAAALAEAATGLRIGVDTGIHAGFSLVHMSSAAVHLDRLGRQRDAAFVRGALQAQLERVDKLPAWEGWVLPIGADALDRSDQELAAAYDEGSALPYDQRVAATLATVERAAAELGLSWAAAARGPRDRPVSGWDALTPAEIDVARRVAEGLTNKQVGEALFVSENTVKTHLKNVYLKLDISSRAELATVVARVDA